MRSPWLTLDAIKRNHSTVHTGRVLWTGLNMSEAEIVDYPVASLPDRYGKARSAIYTQMDKLKIVPIKQGNKAFISSSQLTHLDELNHFLNEDSSRNIDDFIRQTQAETSIEQRSHNRGQLIRQQTGQSFAHVNQLTELNYTFSGHITVLRERFEFLERCAERGWLLPTSDLASLTGLAPSTLIKQSEFQRWGFTFVKRPVKSGQEVTWLVKAPTGHS